MSFCPTYGRDDGDGEVKGPREPPLDPSLVRLELEHDPLELVKIHSAQIVLVHQLLFAVVQDLLLRDLHLRLQSVKNGRADEQIRESAYDQHQGPDVLSLHDRSERTLRTDGDEGAPSCIIATDRQ